MFALNSFNAGKNIPASATVSAGMDAKDGAPSDTTVPEGSAAPHPFEAFAASAIPAAPLVPEVAASAVPAGPAESEASPSGQAHEAAQEHVPTQAEPETVAAAENTTLYNNAPYNDGAPDAGMASTLPEPVAPLPDDVAFNNYNGLATSYYAEVSGIDAAPAAETEALIPQTHAASEAPPFPEPAHSENTLAEGNVMPVLTLVTSAASESVPAISGDAPADPIAALEAEHAKWLASEGKEGKRANLRGLDLTGADLSGRCFMEASLRGVILAGANLSGIDLRAADMAEANLDNANLAGAKLSGATLARAQMHKAVATGADFTTANFTGAIAEGMDLKGARLDGAILRDANFRQANFALVSLRDANLRGATAVDADLSGADLTSADCRDTNFDRARFKDAVLHGTNFRGAKLGDVDLQATDFSGALDVAAEVMAQSAQAERGKLQEEQARIAALSEGLETREKAIATERERLATEALRLSALQAAQGEQAQALAGLTKNFMISAALWAAFALVIVGLTAMVASQLQHMKTGRVIFVVGLSLFAFVLSLFSLLQSLRAMRLVKESIPGMPSGRAGKPLEDEAPVPELLPDMPRPQPSGEKKAPGISPAREKRGSGFGKKK